jgi:tRNA pseudouridine38-40 synthase
MEENDRLLYYRATVCYDGTDFLGFQWQAQGRTVQAALEAALAQLTGEQRRVVGAGRTDAGVHASGQVVGFRAEWSGTVGALQAAMNAVLPADLVVSSMSPAPDGWHPRFSARRRAYRYTVLNIPVRSPLERRFSHWVRQDLDIHAMEAAAGMLVGEHDFAAFGRPMKPDESTTRRVISAHWREEAPGSGRLYFDVVGNAFLRGMVRCIVGALLQVGTGRWQAERVGLALASRDRSLAAPPAPACGLCLTYVDYEGEVA